MKKKILFSLDCAPPPGHEKTPTEDGTFTFKNLKFEENCHSTAGAYEETIFNYVNGTEILNKTHLPEINILEVGFGLGLGPIATFEALSDYKGQLNFFSTELDEGLINWFCNSISSDLNRNFPYASLEKEKNGHVTSYIVSSKNRRLEIFCGDLMKTCEHISLPKIHAIYQDPFSPKKNPSLWSHGWFKYLKDISSEDVVLSTYSASHSVHQNLKDAGWIVYRAPGFAHKRSSTRACINDLVYKGIKK